MNKWYGMLGKNIILAFFLLFQSGLVYSQNCSDRMIESKGPDSFAVNGDGTVTQKYTGLMWQVCSVGQIWRATDGACTNESSSVSWQEALQEPAVRNMQGGFAGYNDWRLPNVKELAGLVKSNCYGPAVEYTVFSNTPSGFYWSSSPASDIANVAWGIDFLDGGTDVQYRYQGGYIRLVRDVE